MGSVMGVKAVTAGFVISGLVAAGAVTVLVVAQPVPVRQVQLVSPAADVSVPTVTATVEPVVVPTTVAPVPVESASVAAPVVVAPKEVVVTSQPASAPKATPVIVQTDGNDPAFAGRYYDGTPVVKDAAGNVIVKRPIRPRIIGGITAPQSDGHGVPIPTP